MDGAGAAASSAPKGEYPEAAQVKRGGSRTRGATARAEEPGIVRITTELIGRRDSLLVAHPDLVRAARVRATMDFLLEILARDAAQWSGEEEASGLPRDLTGRRSTGCPPSST